MGLPALPSPCSAAARVRAAPLLTSRTRTGGAALGGGVAAQSAVRRSRTARSPPPSIWRNGVGRADPGAIVPGDALPSPRAACRPLSGGCALVRPSAGSRPALPLRAGRTARWPRRKRTPRPSARFARFRSPSRGDHPPAHFPSAGGSGSAPARCLSRGAGWRGAPACHPRPPAQSSSNTWSINYSRDSSPAAA